MKKRAKKRRQRGHGEEATGKALKKKTLKGAQRKLIHKSNLEEERKGKPKKREKRKRKEKETKRKERKDEKEFGCEY